ncbi:hypothetical protein L915_02972 [Phytophthora nicotianae]|uniref:Uncharacterized protein n=1 Tax=Phytophthora nicotianae TaxID=4792 RepID=W2JNU2_PHYNI|nr:hypothetical protein L915_02972 [Phytophthora nicotianae]ETL47293.1 hypothetical protein L916_02948 [Phytophthora nicotianae]ETM53599.1 hypothetical protein L914_02938 [Phytophthora nicotianae]
MLVPPHVSVRCHGLLPDEMPHTLKEDAQLVVPPGVPELPIIGGTAASDLAKTTTYFRGSSKIF